MCRDIPNREPEAAPRSRRRPRCIIQQHSQTRRGRPARHDHGERQEAVLQLLDAVIAFPHSFTLSIFHRFILFISVNGKEGASWSSIVAPSEQGDCACGEGMHSFALSLSCSHGMHCPRTLMQHVLRGLDLVFSLFSTFLPTLSDIFDTISRCSKLRECCRQIEAEVVSNSRRNIHETWSIDLG